MRELNEQMFCGWCGAGVVYKSTWMSECTNCKHQRYINPNPCSSIMIANKNKILLVKRAIEPKSNYYDLLGGFMDMTDKSMEQASVRELKEELALTTSDVTELKYYGSSLASYEWKDTQVWNIVFFYLCELKNPNQKITVDDHENSEILWVSKEDLPSIKLAWDSDRQMLTKFFQELS